MSCKHMRGFTLIELLVVLGVISLLSSVILANVNAARLKAQNAFTIQTVNEYKMHCTYIF
jgi:prepilin-type N-terminal cleavage/methylation domain-containing protein